MRYEVMITKKHWLTVEASSDAEAFDLAEEMIPIFPSEFNDTQMEITGTWEENE